MKTEANVKSTMRSERRKVFWRLYSLPWIISIILLILISSGFIWIIRDMYTGNIEREICIHKEGIIEGRVQLSQEAISVGVGSWEVDNFGVVKFSWNEPKPEPILSREIKDTKTDVRALVRRGSEKQEIREKPYTWEDHKLGQKIGIDVEDNIVRSIRMVTHRVFLDKGTNGLLELELSLKDLLEETIHREFDGFETYNKVK